MKSLLQLKRELDPRAFSEALRARGPAFFCDAAGFHVVTDHALAKIVLSDPAFSADRSSFFVSRMPRLDLSLIEDFFGLVRRMMVMSDGQDHEKRRKAAALGLDGPFLESLLPRIEATVDELLARALRKASFDFAEEIAAPLPAAVLAELFAIPAADRPKFFRLAQTMTAFFGGASEYNDAAGLRVNAAAVELKAYFRRLLTEKRDRPGEDFFTVLLQNPFALSDEEMIAQAVMMLVAGQVTTTDQLNADLHTLLSEGAWKNLSVATLPAALEEARRLDPAVSFIFRTVRARVQLGTVTLFPNDVVFVSNHAVNRDPEVFADPNSFRLDRPRNPHFAFGHGPHFCLGSRLARIAMKICFERLLAAAPGLCLRKAVRDHYALSFSGFQSLEILSVPKPPKE